MKANKLALGRYDLERLEALDVADLAPGDLEQLRTRARHAATRIRPDDSAPIRAQRWTRLQRAAELELAERQPEGRGVMTRDPRTTPEYQRGLNWAYHAAAVHLHRVGRHEDAEMFGRFASQALRDAERMETA